MKTIQILFFFFVLITNSIQSQIQILDEDFQQGIPLNWTIITNDLFVPVDAEYTNGWISILDPENNLDTVASSTSFFAPTGISNRWLITPLLSMGIAGNSISWKAKSHDPSFPDDYLVLVSKTGNQISDFVDTIGWVQEENFEWTFRSAEFDDAKFASQNIYVAFVNTTNNGFKLYLDSVNVFVNDASGISENKNTTLSIYPNPTTDQLFIQSPHVISSAIVFNSSGQILISDKSKSIDVSSLIPGFYYLEIVINGYKITERFIKQ
jgi:hypothetical protein